MRTRQIFHAVKVGENRCRVRRGRRVTLKCDGYDKLCHNDVLTCKKKRKRCDDVILQKRRHPDARFLTFWPRIQSFLSLRPPLYFNPRGLLDLRQREEGGEPTRSLTQPAWRPHRQQGGTATAVDVNALDVCFKGDRQRWRTEQRGCSLVAQK